MKNIFKFVTILFATSAVFYSCQESDNAVDFLQDNVEGGGILRTISVNNNTLNSSIPESMFSVTLEEQDDENGGLFESVSVYGTFNDLTPENGTTEIEGIFVKDIPASAFSTGERGLPVGDVVATYGEIAAAMGLNNDNVLPGDVIVIQLRLNLTDGRVFTDTNTAGTITGGAYFSSPFLYTTLILCSPVPGAYTVIMGDTYGDGWQTSSTAGGPGLTIMIDDVEIQVGICSPYETPSYDCLPGNGSGDGSVPDTGIEAIINVPEGTELLTWELPGDAYGEINFQVYAPNGDLLYDRQPGGDIGLLPILLCL